MAIDMIDMNEYQKSFTDPLEHPRAGLEEAAAALDTAGGTSEHWPEAHTKLDLVVVATLKRWLRAVTSLLKPIDFWPLRRERLRLGLWRGAKWFHPRVVQARLRNLALYFRFLLGWIWLNRALILKIIAYTAIFITLLSAAIWLLLNWNDLISSIRTLLGASG